MEGAATRILWIALLASAARCSPKIAASRSSSLPIECQTSEIPPGKREFAVFDGHVSEFLGRRLRVVDGDLRWGSQSFGPVRPGDSVRFTDAGFVINGAVREPVDIDLEFTLGHVSGHGQLQELDLSPSRMPSHLNWAFIDETLHVGELSYGPIKPGDKVKIAEGVVSINGKLAEALH
jgi:hypothetical protein